MSTDLLAQLIEQLRHVARRRVVFERNLHRGEGRLGVGRHFVEVRQFLQLLFDRVGDLRLHFGGSRTRPHGGDDHDLDGERGIFRAAQAAIGKQASHTKHDDQEQDQGGMRDRPC